MDLGNMQYHHFSVCILSIKSKIMIYFSILFEINGYLQFISRPSKLSNQIVSNAYFTDLKLTNSLTFFATAIKEAKDIPVK